MGDISSDYHRKIVDGIIEEAKEYDTKVVTFSNFGAYGVNEFRGLGERSIVKLPNLDLFDGIIIDPVSFDVEGMYEDLCARIEERVSCPVIVLREKDTRFYSVLNDNESAMYEMTSHIIKKHCPKRICYMSGPKDSEESNERLAGFRKAMKDYGFQIDEKDIFYGDFWVFFGEKAVSVFCEHSIPDAIICANDHMAFAVMEALEKREIRVPMDVIVTGFDDVDDAAVSVPSLTSVRLDCQEFGALAVRYLFDVITGKTKEKIRYGKTKPFYRNSCGCSDGIDHESIAALYEIKRSTEHVLQHFTYMITDFENMYSFRQLIYCAVSYGHFDYERLFFCFRDSNEKTEEVMQLTKKVELRCVVQGTDYEFMNELFDRENLLPERFLHTSNPLFTFVFYAKGNFLGYVVIEMKSAKSLRYVIHPWIVSLSSAYNRLLLSEENEILTEMRSYYNMDALTGLPNRREFESVLKETEAERRKEDKPFFLMSIDMDGLKYINDNFGHAKGDVAIRRVAEILDEVMKDRGFVARVGGDEFLVILNASEEIQAKTCVARIRHQIDEWNEREYDGFPVSVSIGYEIVLPDSDISLCMNQADMKMYEEKASKKQSRR